MPFFVSWEGNRFFPVSRIMVVVVVVVVGGGGGGGGGQANWMLYLFPHGLQTFSSSWIMLKAFRQMPQVDISH